MAGDPILKEAKSNESALVHLFIQLPAATALAQCAKIPKLYSKAWFFLLVGHLENVVLR